VTSAFSLASLGLQNSRAHAVPLTSSSNAGSRVNTPTRPAERTSVSLRFWRITMRSFASFSHPMIRAVCSPASAMYLM